MRQCIVIADRARARLFSVEEERDTPFEEGRRRLKEHRDLVSPEGKLTDHDLFRDTRPGRRGRPAVASGGYTVDDGKSRQRAESARRFAKDLVEATADLLRARKPKRLLLIASPKFLGVLRRQLEPTIPKGVELAALAEDLSWHAPARIEQVLARRGVFDGGERLEESRTARGPRKKTPRSRKKRP
jgi:protein required for attachment to host cells